MSEKSNKKLLLGAHMLIADGLGNAIREGEKLGCTTIQIFTKSARQWKAKDLDPEKIKVFKENRKESFLGPIAAHASYLINIGSPNSATQNRSIAALIEELKRCNELGVDYLVLHPGSALNSSPEECINTIADSINQAFDSIETKTKLLLETTAGQGTNVGHSFEQIGEIIKKVHNKSRIGVCLDTCHVYAAGYDISNPEGYKTMWDKFDKQIGLKYLNLIHLNDSATPLGSKKDRHAHIGKGEIGLEGFGLLLNDPKLADTPKILETPGGTKEDAVNLETLVNLIEDKNKDLVLSTPLKKYLKK
ncbi:MAG TPA: deoxyribonuclease IV [Candidatus Babeliales bacterium]|nr:deoxyribonuclease IV [Candidatus Babeliales bacterium]